MGKHVLITGANSYIGTAVETSIKRYPEKYSVETLDMRNKTWEKTSFSGYDVVFHVAGIAHQKETKKNAKLYYMVNEKLAVKTARKAKQEGVKQFIILSSMSVYGMETGYITKNSVPKPKSNYAKSKFKADQTIKMLETPHFKVAILRPPMVYGKNCKGNYQALRKFALRTPLFPDIKNVRSMIFIDNLAEFVKQVIDGERTGIYFPQDDEYRNTAEMVKKIAEIHGKKVRLTHLFNPVVFLGEKLGVGSFRKVFGSLTYEPCDVIKSCAFDEIMLKTEK